MQACNPLALCTGSMPSWCVGLPREFPSLFSLDTRLSLLRKTAFGMARAVAHTQVCVLLLLLLLLLFLFVVVLILTRASSDYVYSLTRLRFAEIPACNLDPIQHLFDSPAPLVYPQTQLSL